MEIVSDETDDAQLDRLPPTDRAILVLNTKPFEAKPLVFDLNGKVLKEKLDNNFLKGNVDDDLNWDYRNLTGAFFGCATLHRDEMLYFGGVGADSRQVTFQKNDGRALLFYRQVKWKQKIVV